MTASGNEEQDKDALKANLERYLLMDDKEKDLEIQKAVIRLQKRIQEILYLLETEKQSLTKSRKNN